MRPVHLAALAQMPLPSPPAPSRWAGLQCGPGLPVHPCPKLAAAADLVPTLMLWGTPQQFIFDAKVDFASPQ